MALTFSEDDHRKMRALEQDLKVVLKQANDQRLEAAIAAFALIRCARTLLHLYPVNTRAALLSAIFPFLAGSDVEIEGEPVLGSSFLRQ
jgi:hypothetical protein